MYESNALLRQFYRELTLEREGGIYTWFQPRYALCKNLEYWCDVYHQEFKFPYRTLRIEMGQSFAEAGLDRVLPFNESFYDYTEEAVQRRFWLNPQRLEWVRSHAI